jgi:hypothetical protein
VGLEFFSSLKNYEGLVIETTDNVYASEGFPMAETFLSGRPS